MRSSLRPNVESREVAVGLEQTSVDDAPDLVDTVAEDEAAILDGDRGDGAREDIGR